MYDGRTWCRSRSNGTLPEITPKCLMHQDVLPLTLDSFFCCQERGTPASRLAWVILTRWSLWNSWHFTPANQVQATPRGAFSGTDETPIGVPPDEILAKTLRQDFPQQVQWSSPSVPKNIRSLFGSRDGTTRKVWTNPRRFVTFQQTDPSSRDSLCHHQTLACHTSKTSYKLRLIRARGTSRRS